MSICRVVDRALSGVGDDMGEESEGKEYRGVLSSTRVGITRGDSSM